MSLEVPLQCSYELFWSSDYSFLSKCASFTIGQCSSLQSLLDYFSFYWCSLHGNFLALFFIILFFLPFLLKFLSNIKHESLFPSTLYLLEWMKCPKTLASLTFLPFLNSSIEFFLIIAASVNKSADSYGFSLIYGEILVFIGLIIPGIIIYFSTDFHINKASFQRDMAFFMIATIYWIILGGIGEISLTFSLIYLCFYLFYMMVIAYQSTRNVKNPYYDEHSSEKSSENNEIQSDRSDIKVTPQENPSKYHNLKEYDPKNAYKYMIYDNNFIEKAPGFFYIYQNSILKNVFSSKIMEIIDFPFNILRKFTIPTTDPLKYQKLDLLLWPIPGVFFLSWGLFGTPSFYWFYIIAPIAVFLVFFTIITASETEVPYYYPTIQILAWICSVVWMYRLSQILIDTIQIVSIFTNLDHNFFALFFFAKILAFQVIIPAWEIAKKGEKIDILFNSIVFNQVFQVLVAIGIANIIEIANYGNISFPLFERGNVILSFLMISLLVVIGVFWGFLAVKGWKIGRKMAWMMICGFCLIEIGCLIAGIVLATTSIK